jgi:hypothetical protein
MKKKEQGIEPIRMAANVQGKITRAKQIDYRTINTYDNLTIRTFNEKHTT